jgi:hypothetical protein
MLRDPNSFIASFVNGWTDTSTSIFQPQSTLESESFEIFSTMAPPHGKLTTSFFWEIPDPPEGAHFPCVVPECASWCVSCASIPGHIEDSQIQVHHCRGFCDTISGNWSAPKLQLVLPMISLDNHRPHSSSFLLFRSYAFSNTASNEIRRSNTTFSPAFC